MDEELQLTLSSFSSPHPENSIDSPTCLVQDAPRDFQYTGSEMGYRHSPLHALRTRFGSSFSESSAFSDSKPEPVVEDPDTLYDAITTAGVPKQTMPDVFKAMRVWHCRCCTRLNTHDSTRCTMCDTHRGSMGISPNAADVVSTDTGIGYDERMKLHREMEPNNVFEQHPERPDRIAAIMEQLQLDGLVEECTMVEPKVAKDDELRMVHTNEHCEFVVNSCKHSPYHINGDTYVCSDTDLASRLSAGIVMEMTKQIVQGKLRNGFAVVRPPGHHAEANQAMGFCMYNNVALAARMARDEYNVQRVLVVDWDIHHGNGTEHMFEEDPTIMYCSLHRFDHGEFYPGTGASQSIGKGAGKGFTVNVAWPHEGMGDAEYVAAFSHVLMPVFASFNPELVLVSAGFDSAMGDPLGGCMITPAGFAYMTAMLATLGHGRLLLALEGGYNLNSISTSAAACIRVLLGYPAPPLDLQTVQESAMQAITETQRHLSPYWKCLRMQSNTISKESQKKPYGSNHHLLLHSNSILSPRMVAQLASANRMLKGQTDSNRERRSSFSDTVDQEFSIDTEFPFRPSDPTTSFSRRPQNRTTPQGRKEFLVWRWWASRRKLRALRLDQSRQISAPTAMEGVETRPNVVSPISDLALQSSWTLPETTVHHDTFNNT